ncbi:Major facilitator super domain-containing protein 7 [Phytophthora pseudosyringae]|uniref:Major facilitator super domain-containing protein 7 n=1 Tax=Phytophthora pseudosyringae TaxID=221518 RepID=A0A8T1VH72_9STRA|nr:Major facilitator super domain-containing protein 7 [Phytophthora pseudosyringae]
MTALVYEVIDAKGGYGTLLRRPKGAATSTNQKWVMLAILSVLSAVSQAICYSYAPIASIVEDRWEQRLPSEHLITIFFISYMPCSFVGSWIVDKFGLRFGVLLGGVLQALGAGLRYFACTLDRTDEIYVTLVGQTLASLAMAFMVNSPAVLSANWFPPSMRATSTSVALNANNLGTAVVYLTAPFVVFSADDIPNYNLYVAVFALVSWVLALFVFRSSPNSRTGEPKSAAHDEYDWGQWRSAFSHNGFWHTLVPFSLAECVFNTISALLGKFLSATKFTKEQIGLVGAAFIISSLFGGQMIGRYVDKRRNHKTAIQICLLLTAVGLALFRLVPKVKVHATLGCLLFLGVVLGPLQPLGLELGVECAYPTSETTVAALQQLFGNFFSAIAVPGLSSLQRTNFQAPQGISPSYFYGSPEWIMAFMTTATLIVFCFFDGEHKRFHYETKVVLPRTSPDDETMHGRGPEDSTA